MELQDLIRFLELDDLMLSCVLGVIVMNSAMEPAEKQPMQPMDTEAASQIELYENERRFSWI